VWLLSTNKESALFKYPHLTPFAIGLKSLDNGFAAHGFFLFGCQSERELGEAALKYLMLLFSFFQAKPKGKMEEEGRASLNWTKYLIF